MEQVEILKKLIGFNTVSPPGNEYQVINYVKKFFEENKIPYEVFAKERKRQKFISSLFLNFTNFQQ